MKAVFVELPRSNVCTKVEFDVLLACEAGVSIKPGAQAPGQQFNITRRARTAGGSAVARCAGSKLFGDAFPGACAPGFMLTPASQAKRKKEAMKRSVKPTRKRSARRDLFAELSEGMDVLADARHGKRTLRTHALEFKPAPSLTPKELVRVRKNLKLSRALFAIYLRTNVRTLENWEQGRAKPNAQAALLINLVKHYPDTVQRLASI